MSEGRKDLYSHSVLGQSFPANEHVAQPDLINAISLQFIESHLAFSEAHIEEVDDAEGEEGGQVGDEQDHNL